MARNVMSDPISVAAIRGGTVEALHRVHAVAVDADNRLVASAGNPALVTFMRSSAKPLQALSLARLPVNLEPREIGIACASHLARPEQVDAVRALLRRAGAGEDDLVCGLEGDPPSRLNHNCSGNHAGMLLVCRDRGWEISGYGRPDHPIQRALVDEVAAAAELSTEQVVTAGDNCGVLTFGLTLERMALAFARLAGRDGGERVIASMRSDPDLVRGPESPDSRLMRLHPGWVAKGGAEALLCAMSPEGVGIAVKVEDGGARAVGPGLAAFLARLGIDAGDLASTPVLNSRGEPVGEIAAKEA
jgi:L-asparaginase